MKLLQFAVASLVDANTGGNLARHVNSSDIAAAEREAHAIRSRSIIALGQSIGSAIKRALAVYRERREAKRALDELLSLSDHHLEDIGLHRGDLIAVKLGVTSLEALNARREARRELTNHASVTRIDERSVAGNEADLVATRCA